VPKEKRPTIPATEGAAGQSVVKRQYRERYEDDNCGDRLARRLRRHLETDGGTIDLGRLHRLAERNGGRNEALRHCCPRA
jgi:hypothetical protein